MTSPDDLGSVIGGREPRAPRSPRWSGLLRTRKVQIAVAAAAAGAIVVIGALAMSSPQDWVASVSSPAAHPASPSQSSSTEPTSTTITEPAAPGDASTANQSTTPIQPVDWTLRIDALGIAAPIDGMKANNGVVDPPTHDAAYWLSEYGAPSVNATNTVYLVGHSWSKGPAVFNSFTDAQSQQSKVPVGTTIVVAAGGRPLTYVVDATARYAKSQLTTTKDVWAIVPGRLVLITCFLYEGVARSPDNFVVYAHLVTPGS